MNSPKPSGARIPETSVCPKCGAALMRRPASGTFFYRYACGCWAGPPWSLVGGAPWGWELVTADMLAEVRS